MITHTWRMHRVMSGREMALMRREWPTARQMMTWRDTPQYWLKVTCTDQQALLIELKWSGLFVCKDGM